MPRRQIQRSFLTWLDTNRLRFAIPIRLGLRTATSLDFFFVGINDVISGWLSTYDITIAVTYEGECWDFLIDFDASPKRVPGGYICDLCPPEGRPVFTDRPSLWAMEIFEPFLGWVNENLAKAKWIKLESDRGVTWARLLTEDEPPQQLQGGGMTLRLSDFVADSPSPSTERRTILLPCRVP